MSDVIQSDRDAAEKLKRQLQACAYGNDLNGRALNYIQKLEKDCASYVRTMDVIAADASSADLRAKLDVAREALEAIKYEAERENGGWVHLKQVIAVNAVKALATIGGNNAE